MTPSRFRRLLRWLGLAVVLLFVLAAPRTASHSSATLSGAPPISASTVRAGDTGLVREPHPLSGAPQTVIAAALYGGTATWYCGHGSACTRGYFPDDMVAAVDPSLGIERGTWLTVRHGSREVLVRAVDVCGCSGRRILDLMSGAFSRLAPLSEGVIVIELEVGATLPPTDTDD